MDIVDIIKDSLQYPVDNYVEWIMMAILFFVSSLVSVVIGSSADNAVVGVIFSVISLVILLITEGYALKFAKKQIVGSEVTSLDMNELPTNLVADLINGFKLAVIGLVYLLVYGIIMAIISYLLGFFDKVTQFSSYFINAYQANPAAFNINAVINTIPTDVLANVMTASFIVAVIGVILIIITAVISYVAIGRFAETDSIVAALNVPEVCKKISEIGIGKFVVFCIIFIIVLIILDIISGIVALIPAVGNIIAATIVESFIMMFVYVALGKRVLLFSLIPICIRQSIIVLASSVIIILE